MEVLYCDLCGKQEGPRFKRASRTRRIVARCYRCAKDICSECVTNGLAVDRSPESNRWGTDWNPHFCAGCEVESRADGDPLFQVLDNLAELHKEDEDWRNAYNKRLHVARLEMEAVMQARRATLGIR